MIIRILLGLFDKRPRPRDLCLAQAPLCFLSAILSFLSALHSFRSILLSFRSARVGSDGSLMSQHTTSDGDRGERAADYGRPEHAPRVSGLSLGLVVFGVQFALALQLSFRPLGVARRAAFRQELHGGRKSGMIARGPGLVRLVFVAAIER